MNVETTEDGGTFTVTVDGIAAGYYYYDSLSRAYTVVRNEDRSRATARSMTDAERFITSN